MLTGSLCLLLIILHHFLILRGLYVTVLVALRGGMHPWFSS